MTGVLWYPVGVVRSVTKPGMAFQGLYTKYPRIRYLGAGFFQMQEAEALSKFGLGPMRLGSKI